MSITEVAYKLVKFSEKNLEKIWPAVKALEGKVQGVKKEARCEKAGRGNHEEKNFLMAVWYAFLKFMLRKDRKMMLSMYIFCIYHNFFFVINEN